MSVSSQRALCSSHVGQISVVLIAVLGVAQSQICSDYGFAEEDVLQCGLDCLIHKGSRFERCAPLWEVHVRECAACDTSNTGTVCETFGGIDRRCTNDLGCDCKGESGASPLCCNGDTSMVCKQDQCVTIDSLRGLTCGNNPSSELVNSGFTVQRVYKCESGAWDETPTTTRLALIDVIIPPNEPAEVNDFDCNLNAAPILVYQVEGGFEFRSLDASTGDYSLLYDVPFARTSPAYNDLNSCGLNPLDSRVYCAMRIGLLIYLVRLDSTTVTFVACLPEWPRSGGFGPSGATFYLMTGGLLADLTSRLYSVERPHEKPGYENSLALEIEVLLDLPFLGLGFGATSDLVAVSINPEGTGTK
mmetsp:Transcript_39195/g.85638  ORF Transcript_39195/g.85638 Transcript_39195/m.85638 type:complete len:360 (+) Transcript_39195:91-1170(+)